MFCVTCEDISKYYPVLYRIVVFGTVEGSQSSSILLLVYEQNCIYLIYAGWGLFIHSLPLHSAVFLFIYKHCTYYRHASIIEILLQQLSSTNSCEKL